VNPDAWSATDQQGSMTHHPRRLVLPADQVDHVTHHPRHLVLPADQVDNVTRHPRLLVPPTTSVAAEVFHTFQPKRTGALLPVRVAHRRPPSLFGPAEK